jgi:hypothetical protein
MTWLEHLCSQWLERLSSRQDLSLTQIVGGGSDIGVAFQWETSVSQRNFLHVGCGGSRKEDAAPGFRGDKWREIRLDMDSAAKPDIVASMTDMALVPDAAVDAIYSSHNTSIFTHMKCLWRLRSFIGYSSRMVFWC